MTHHCDKQTDRNSDSKGRSTPRCAAKIIINEWIKTWVLCVACWVQTARISWITNWSWSSDWYGHWSCTTPSRCRSGMMMRTADSCQSRRRSSVCWAGCRTNSLTSPSLTSPRTGTMDVQSAPSSTELLQVILHFIVHKKKLFVHRHRHQLFFSAAECWHARALYFNE